MKKSWIWIVCITALVLGFAAGWFANQLRPKYDADWNLLKGEAHQVLASEPGYAEHQKVIDALLEIRHDTMRCEIKGRPQEQPYLSTLLLFMETDAENLQLTGAGKVISSALSKRFRPPAK